jgi:acetylornithine deacetylase/succinyl-diaminopimelate desuccinylase-like protein
MLGPGDEALAHTDEEMVSIHDLEVAVRVYVRIMKAMDGRETP